MRYGMWFLVLCVLSQPALAQLGANPNEVCGKTYVCEQGKTLLEDGSQVNTLIMRPMNPSSTSGGGAPALVDPAQAREMESLKSDLVMLQGQLEKSEEAKRKLEVTKAELEAKVATLEKQMQEVDGTNSAAIKIDLIDAKRKLKRVQGKRNELDELCNRLTNKVADLDQQIDNLQDQLQTSQARTPNRVFRPEFDIAASEFFEDGGVCRVFGIRQLKDQAAWSEHQQRGPELTTPIEVIQCPCSNQMCIDGAKQKGFSFGKDSEDKKSSRAKPQAKPGETQLRLELDPGLLYDMEGVAFNSDFMIGVRSGGFSIQFGASLGTTEEDGGSMLVTGGNLRLVWERDSFFNPFLDARFVARMASGAKIRYGTAALMVGTYLVPFTTLGHNWFNLFVAIGGGAMSCCMSDWKGTHLAMAGLALRY